MNLHKTHTELLKNIKEELIAKHCFDYPVDYTYNSIVSIVSELVARGYEEGYEAGWDDKTASM